MILTGPLGRTVERTDIVILAITNKVRLVLFLNTDLFGQDMDTNGVFLWVGPEINLGKNLIRERVAHHEARMPHGTAQVDQTTLGQ